MAGYKCAKYFTVFLSTLVFLVGGLCLISGLLLKLESGILETEVVSLINRIVYNNIPIGVVADALAYMMICFGFLILCVAVLGICGAWRDKRTLLIMFIVCVVFMVIVQGTLIGLWITIRGRADQWLKGQMMEQLKSYEGPEATDTVSKGWNKLFMTAHCCGVNDQFKNGGTNSDFTELPSTWTSANDKVPATCCQGVDSGSISSFKNSARCTKLPKNFYTEGCYDKVVTYVNVYSLIAIIACGALVIVEILVIVSSCVVMESVKNKVSGIGSANTRAPPYVAIEHWLRGKKPNNNDSNISKQ